METHIVSSRLIRALPAFGLLLCVSAAARQRVVTVEAKTFVTPIRVYAQVVPIVESKLRTALPGVLTGLSALPGEELKGGTAVGYLKGPGVDSVLAQRRSSVTREQATLQAASRSLAIVRQKRASHLSTTQAVYNAAAAVSQAKAGLAAARAALKAVREQSVLRVPATGKVLSLAAANGERLDAGETVLTIQPRDHLWIRAVYYGIHVNAIHTGMRGRFVPASGGDSVPVEVVSVLAPIGPDGGLPLGLRPTNKNARLPSGEAGTVTLNGKPRTGIAVPNSALILDRGRWWVLVRSGQHDERRLVSRGLRVGGDTLVERGLSAGTKVVLDGAYLRFHRDVAQHYQPPD